MTDVVTEQAIPEAWATLAEAAKELPPGDGRRLYSVTMNGQTVVVAALSQQSARSKAKTWLTAGWLDGSACKPITMREVLEALKKHG